jgi:hypothetical protein
VGKSDLVTLAKTLSWPPSCFRLVREISESVSSQIDASDLQPEKQMNKHLQHAPHRLVPAEEARPRDWQRHFSLLIVAPRLFDQPNLKRPFPSMEIDGQREAKAPGERNCS